MTSWLLRAPYLEPITVGITYRIRYTLSGLFLALGAPGGSLLLRTVWWNVSFEEELAAQTFYYIYMLVGTSIVFGATGFLAGFRADVLAQQRDSYQELSEIDELTGLMNFRAFWQRYRRAVERASRFGEPLALLIVDVDHLKTINDQEGHRFGNLALRHISSQIGVAARAEDLTARWGGDEFVILMAGAGLDSATRVAASLLTSITSRPVSTHRTERIVTVTIGIASFQPGQPIEGLFDRADRALYEAKRLGGNQYQVAA